MGFSVRSIRLAALPAATRKVDILSMWGRCWAKIERFGRKPIGPQHDRGQAGLKVGARSAPRGGGIAEMALTRASMPVGIVVRKTPGVTRWAKWSWRVVAVLPGAAPAKWRELRREGEVVEYHAATLNLDLWSTDTEAYLVGLAAKTPSVIVVLRDAPDADIPFEPAIVTASPYEGQDYLDSGEGLIEAVPMPLGMIGWIMDFVQEHHVEEVFIKRKRDKKRVDLVEDGKGDARIRQISDVFRAPRNGEVP